MAEDIKWLGHASFLIKGGEKVIYFDPWKVAGNLPRADLVLISHVHYDHCSVSDVEKLIKDGTVVVVTQDCHEKFGKARVEKIRPGESFEAGGLKVEALSAYNIYKQYHPKEMEWVGYILTLPDGKRVYHTGDSDSIPEMHTLKVDVALLPVGGQYTMDAQEAAELCSRMKPQVAIPMHFGSIVGSIKDADRFKELVQKKSPEVEVRILTPSAP